MRYPGWDPRRLGKLARGILGRDRLGSGDLLHVKSGLLRWRFIARSVAHHITGLTRFRKLVKLDQSCS